PRPCTRALASRAGSRDPPRSAAPRPTRRAAHRPATGSRPARSARAGSLPTSRTLLSDLVRRHATTAFAMAFALAPPAAAAAQGSTWHLGPPCEPIQVLRAEREVVMVCPHRVTVLDAQTRAERWSRQSRDPIVRVVRDEGGELVAVTARRSRVPLGATDGPRSPSGRAGVVAASDRDRASVRLDPGAAAEVGQAL